jgi:hypothetical protein
MGNVHIISTLQNKKNQKKSIFFSSSSVFFGIFNKECGIDTEVSLLNHFLLKRGITDAQATIKIRDAAGNLHTETKISLNSEQVYSFRLSEYVNSAFLGSIYVFFDSKENLAIPFCAVTGTIKTNHSVCGVHTYGRRLEQKELGTNIDLSSTIETGWTLRDTENVCSFAVLHGGEFNLKLKITVHCTNFLGEVLTYDLEQDLHAYGILLLINQKNLDDIISHLAGEPGHAKIHISGLQGVFPRMMCGNYTATKSAENNIIDSEEIQFTHTNFDFSQINQPDAGGTKGYFNQPSLPNGSGIIYPVESNKHININGMRYISNTAHKIEVEPMSQIEIAAIDSNLPSRFVGGSIGNWGDGRLDSECSTGTFIEDYLMVPCHWRWGLLKPKLAMGDSVISILMNEFNRNENPKREVKWRVFSEEGLLLDKNLKIEQHVELNAMDYLPRLLPQSTLWYVFSGEKLEDLNIFSTFYPGNNMSGFAEHAF